MITLSKGGYNKKQAEELLRVISFAYMLMMDARCHGVGNCKSCEYKTVCKDLANLEDYLRNKVCNSI